jgi:pimeloyl-ACP methyl ester carboxylesterase
MYCRGVTVFGLVHGAWHGAWCWEALVAELEARGHETVAVDLPSDDPHAGSDVYAEVIADALGDAEEVVLVGHSLAGLTIPLVAARRPVTALVYLCALLPEPGRSLREQLAAEPEMFQPGFPATERDELDRSWWPDPDQAIAALYNDCARGTAEAAAARLRPQGAPPNADPFPLDAVPSVPSAYAVCRDDRAINPAWSRRAARERLGVDAHELPGDHSPMLSRPEELADLLAALAETVPA